MFRDLSGKKLIVVLGMHRSGTSTITRALDVFGIDLGDKLLPPGFDNTKGYFEDIDFLNLNIEILKSLSHDWDTLGSIQINDFQTQEISLLKDHASSILQTKYENRSIYAIKDPRFSRLLPFWKDVFSDLKLEVFYIIAIRNPLSIHQSLQMRDGFQSFKSYQLCLSYLASSVAYTINCPRFVIDYDMFLTNPTVWLKALATKLKINLDMNSKRYIDYTRDFLDPSLKHHQASLTDLQKDPSIPRRLLTIYTQLLNLVNNSNDNLDKLNTDCLECLNHLQKFDHMIYINDIEKNIVRLKQNVTSLEQDILYKKETLRLRQNQIHDLKNQIHDLKNSTSWKITRPLRRIMQRVKGRPNPG